MSRRGLYIWDLPTRLFHWLLALLVGTSFYTGLTGGFDIMDLDVGFIPLHLGVFW
jgi:cytochrome b